jgi:hypothetical protein
MLLLTSNEAWPSIFLFPTGYVGGIWLTLRHKRFTGGGLTAVFSVAGFIAGVAAVSSNDWWREGPNQSWVGIVIFGAIALLSALLAGALIPRRPTAPDPVTGRAPAGESPPPDLAESVPRVIGWAFIGGVVGFCVGFAVVAVAGIGDFGAGAIVLGAAAVGTPIGGAIGILRTTRTRVH